MIKIVRIGKIVEVRETENGISKTWPILFATKTDAIIWARAAKNAVNNGATRTEILAR